MIEPVVLVHGGAGDIPEWRVLPKLEGVQRAARAGYAELVKTNGTVLDAVVAAIKVMEDDVAFNAGKGSVLTRDGRVEMDAIIMKGSSLEAGCVGSITNVSNPIEIARLVMERTPHVFLAGTGATNFAKENGIPMISDDELITDFAKEALDKFLHGGKESTSELGEEGKHGTVGAVAIDSQGRLACATSTGGMTGKLPGRIGDTPIPGAGGYCDDFVGSCSATGHGEMITRVALSHRIMNHMKSGMNPTEASKEALLYMKERTNGTGGVITLSNKGEIGYYFTSNRMAWAYQKQNEVHYGINKGEDFVNIV